MKFWDVVRADLVVNTGRENFIHLFTAMLFYPGFAAIFRHRIAKIFVRTWLDKLGVLLWVRNVKLTGCHIHLDCAIGPGLCLPHPVAVVLGQGVRIGRNATIYQSVTIGKSTASNAYPVVGDHVVIYAGALIIGPVTVGDRAVIGAGSVVVKDVPADAIVVGNPARILRIQDHAPRFDMS